MEWQLIETAPKDGTYFLACIAGFIPTVSKWYEERHVFDWIDAEVFQNDDAWHEYQVSSSYRPTHWMPLPEPPQTK